MNHNRAVAACRLARVLRVAVLSTVAWAAQANADTYAILSLVGDHLTIAGQERQSGSHLDQNRYEVVTMPGGHFMHREHPARFERELLRVLDGEVPR